MISKALIEANEGHLLIESKGKNRGSFFTFTMKMTKHEIHLELNDEDHSSNSLLNDESVISCLEKLDDLSSYRSCVSGEADASYDSNDSNCL